MIKILPSYLVRGIFRFNKVAKSKQDIKGAKSARRHRAKVNLCQPA